MDTEEAPSQDQPDWWVIRERDREFVLGDDFPPAIREEIKRAIIYIQSMDSPLGGSDTTAIADGGTKPKVNEDGKTLREEVAGKVDVEPAELEDYLRDGRPRDRRSKLNDVVEAIKESETFDKPDSFDQLILIPSALRLHLTDDTINAYNLYQ